MMVSIVERLIIEWIGGYKEARRLFLYKEDCQKSCYILLKEGIF